MDLRVCKYDVRRMRDLGLGLSQDASWVGSDSDFANSLANSSALLGVVSDRGNCDKIRG